MKPETYERLKPLMLPDDEPCLNCGKLLAEHHGGRCAGPAPKPSDPMDHVREAEARAKAVVSYPRTVARVGCECRGIETGPGAVTPTRLCDTHRPLAAGDRVRVGKALIRPLKRFGGRGLERIPRVTATGEEGEGEFLIAGETWTHVKLDGGRVVKVRNERVRRIS